MLALLLLLVAYPSANAIDAYVKAEMAKWHIPGLALAVQRNGKLDLAQGYGLANLEQQTPVRPETSFTLGSITKQFTASAVMLLVQDHKLRLDDSVRSIIPEIPVAWPTITIRHLLSHTSGVVDYTELPGSFAFARVDRTPIEVVRPALDAPLLFQPGERYQYSNTNYILLGMVVQRTTKQSLGTFLKKRAFDPLGMKSTRFNDWTEIIPRRAAGYNWFDGALHNALWHSPTNKWASGALQSTVLDMAKWDAALKTGFPLTKETVKLMQTPALLANGAKAPYGLGNELRERQGHRIAGHGGETFGFTGVLARYVDDNLTVIILANNAHAPVEDFAHRIAALYLHLPAEKATVAKAIHDPDPARSNLLKQLVIDAAKGKIDESLFTPSAVTTIVPVIRREGGEFFATLGTMKSFTLVESRRDGGQLVLTYRAVFSEKTATFTFLLDAATGKIDGIEPKVE